MVNRLKIRRQPPSFHIQRHDSLDRDLPQLGIRVSGTTLSRFWFMLAHYHGQIWNSSEFARASWEGFLLQQVLERLGAAPEECFFWATHSGAELDCLWARGRRRWGFEFKRTTAPTLTRSSRAALDLLGLQRLYVIHAGAETFALHSKVTAVAAARLLDDFGGSLQPA